MGEHTKTKLIRDKDNPSSWTRINTHPKGRARRAALHAQTMFLIRHRGYFVDDQGNRIDEAAYRAKVRSDLHRRLAGAIIYYQVNVDRAMDILRNGEKSRWWDARASKHHAGGDTTGIGVWVARLVRKREAAKKARFMREYNTAVTSIFNGSKK